jgi:hypothetical protein
LFETLTGGNKRRLAPWRVTPYQEKPVFAEFCGTADEATASYERDSIPPPVPIPGRGAASAVRAGA